MSLWIIILSYLIAHFFGRTWRRQRRLVIRFLTDRGHALLKLAGIGKWRLNSVLVMLMVLSLVVLAQLLFRSGSTAAWFIFSTVVLVFSLGSRDLDSDVKDYLDAETDEERDRRAERLACDYRHPVGRHDHESVIKGIFYQSLVRWFGVIFWFLVFGAAGAIGFRLIHSQVSDPVNRRLLNGPQLALAKSVIGWIDLLPAALASLALALVGDFERVITSWREHFVSQHKSLLTWDYAFYPCVGFAMVVAGDEVEEAFDHDYEGKLEQVNAAMSLVWRCVACWLTVIALMILFNWLN